MGVLIFEAWMGLGNGLARVILPNRIVSSAPLHASVAILDISLL